MVNCFRQWKQAHATYSGDYSHAVVIICIGEDCITFGDDAATVAFTLRKECGKFYDPYTEERCEMIYLTRKEINLLSNSVGVIIVVESKSG